MREEISAGRLLLAEYERIKEEQKTRISFRDNLLYATLAAVAAVVAATLNAHGRADLLLLLPPVSLLLGWTYLANDEKISSIGRYIRTELAQRLEAAVPDGSPVFAWESAHRSDGHRRSRKAVQLGVDLTAFCASPLAAVLVYWVNGPWAAPFVLVSAAEALAVGGLAFQFARYADLGA